MTFPSVNNSKDPIMMTHVANNVNIVPMNVIPSLAIYSNTPTTFFPTSANNKTTRTITTITTITTVVHVFN